MRTLFDDPNSGTASQVAISRRSGEKFEPNASLIAEATTRRIAGSSESRNRICPPLLTLKSSQNGAIKIALLKAPRGKGSGLKSKNGDLKDNTPLVLTCNNNNSS